MKMPSTSVFYRMQETYRRRHEPEHLRTFADLCWRLMLLVSLFLAAAALSYGVWTLRGVLASIGIASAPGIPPAALDRAEVERVVSGLHSRRERFEAIKASPVPVLADPGRVR